jgi:hypothetical protein
LKKVWKREFPDQIFEKPLLAIMRELNDINLFNAVTSITIFTACLHVFNLPL